MKYKKATPWIEIKTDYLAGITPVALAEKYKKYSVTSKAINEKASKENWVDEKTTICKNIQVSVENKIKDLTNKALEALESVFNDPLASNKDKISAANATLNISGLKVSKQEITGKNGEPLSVKKIFVTPDEVKEAEKHIQDIIE